jgi:nifR3 family TIM-barrel protein
MYTEFISSEGLIRDAAKSRQKLDIFEYERPIGIQIFGGDIDHMREASEIASAAGPDLVDINYGCPVKNVVCKGAGSSLLQDIDKMVKMTEAVVKASHLPVTVKTRLGWDDNTKNVYEVAERLQDVGIQALTIHGRTRAQLYKGEADWSLIREIKRNPRIKIPIFGNGDVDSPEKAANWRMEYEIDGIMIGRAAIGYPWIFREVKHFFKTGEHLAGPTIEERIEVCRTHLDKSLEWKGPKTGIFEMRRHYANYFKGLPDFKPYRMRLVAEPDINNIYSILEEVAEKFADYDATKVLA